MCFALFRKVTFCSFYIHIDYKLSVLSPKDPKKFCVMFCDFLVIDFPTTFWALAVYVSMLISAGDKNDS